MFRIILRFRKWIFYAAAVVGLAALLWLVFTLPGGPRTERSLVSVAHPIAGITFLARLESNRLTPDQPHTLHVELLAALPYHPDTLQICTELPGSARACEAWPTQNGQYAPSVDLEITPHAETMSQVLTVTVDASRPAPAAPQKPATKNMPVGPRPQTFQESILRLGPIRVEPHDLTTDKWLRALARLRGILKDITLPVLIPLLGVYFARRASQRAEQDEVRRLLLGKVQNLTKQYYTHTVHHARSAITALKGGSDLESTFHLFGLLLFNSRLKRQEGAVFFTSLDAEQVYASCISLILAEVREKMGGEQKFRHALDAFGELRKLKVAPAAPAVQGSPAVPGGLAAAGGGTGTSASADQEVPAPRLADFLDAPIATLAMPADPILISALDFLVAVTSYEYDAPLYEHWYRLPGEIKFLEKFPAAADLRKLPAKKQDAWKDLLKASRQWLNDKPGGEVYRRALPRID